MKRLFFWIVTLSPLMAMAALAGHMVVFTNLPQVLYHDSVRNILFDCITFVSEDVVYKMKPGPCRLNNLEYDVTSIHDANGFRNAAVSHSPDIAVIGDSHAYGWGVTDDEVFSSLLRVGHRYSTINLAVPSYATMRELDALKLYGGDAKYVVVQYCDNDAGENAASLAQGRESFNADVAKGWQVYIANYYDGKAKGLLHPIRRLGVLLGDLSFERKSAWRSRIIQSRKIEQEATAFAQILTRYRDLLAGKRLIVFESSAYGLISPLFARNFDSALRETGWASFRVIDTAKLLSASDFYFLDDHLTAGGHRKLATAVAAEIAKWEGESPMLAAR